MVENILKDTIFSENPINYTNNKYVRYWSSAYPGNTTERILIDDLKNSNLVDKIQEIFYSHFVGYFDKNKAAKIIGTPDMRYIVDHLSKLAYDCSKDYSRELPFLGSNNVSEHSKIEKEIILEQARKYPELKSSKTKLWSYYLDNFYETKNLSDLTDNKMLDCIGQVLLIKQSLGLNSFELYNKKDAPKGKYSNIKELNIYKPWVHGFISVPLGGYNLIIDPIMSSKSFSFMTNKNFAKYSLKPNLL